MAYAKIVHEWGDGSCTAMEVGGDLENPEACVSGVLELYRECVDADDTDVL